MSLSKAQVVPEPHSFEFIGSDFYLHKNVRDLAALKIAQIERLKNQPCLIQAGMTLLFKGLYKGHHYLHRVVDWSLSWIDGQLASLADIK